MNAVPPPEKRIARRIGALSFISIVSILAIIAFAIVALDDGGEGAGAGRLWIGVGLLLGAVLLGLAARALAILLVRFLRRRR